MTWKVGMPNLGHTMEEGKVGEWLKAVGDRVAKGEVIATVETDKATFDVESPADGTLLAIEVPAGTTVPVGATIGTVGQPGQPSLQAPPPSDRSPPAAPEAVAPKAAEMAAPARRAGPLVSPAARALAAELGVDLATLAGTGDGGLITRDDVRAGAKPGDKPAAAPLSLARRAIAEATGRAWRTIPHVTLMRHADVTDIVSTKRFGLTPAIAKAAALALAKHRRFNGWLMEGAFHPAPQVDIGLAVATDAGLMMPVLRRANTKSVAALSAEIEALAARARSGSLDGSQTTDASFSVSTLGRWKIEAFTPIIYAPQVAILGVGGVVRAAREGPDGALRFRSELQLCLAFDHRANDGVQAAEFLAAIVDALSQPDQLGADA